MVTSIRVALFCSAVLLAFAPAWLIAADEGASGIKGTVTVNGKPLPDGKLVLHADGAKPVELSIKDGKYAGDKVPPGTRIVTIEGVGVPAKYGSPETSGLTVEIKAGANELAFDLKT